ncbi:MAG TPA: hypothetical protein VGC10_04565 [Sphingomonas sp.]
MSEYQYYEFQALDRPLDAADREALRALSTRARITATSFTNSYEWGNFKGDPAKLMERWFDLHIYLANWGTREFMMRLPTRLVDRKRIASLLRGKEYIELKPAGDKLILTIMRDEMEPKDDWDDGSGWLTALAPLRAAVLAGDLRLFYLVWLMEVQSWTVEPDEPEPLPGLGPMTGPLEAFAEFFDIDPDLVAAASEGIGAAPELESADAIREILDGLPGEQKTAFLVRLIDGDPHVANELRALVRKRLSPGFLIDKNGLRTAGMIRDRAKAILGARQRAAAAKAAAERQQREKETAKAQRARLAALVSRGDEVWSEIETEVERRNAAGYDRAMSLLVDLRMLADEHGSTKAFVARLENLHRQHTMKRRFVERSKSLLTST